MAPQSFDPRMAPRGLQRFTRPKAPEAFPARIHHRRIYILPTVFGAYLAMMMMAILLGAMNNGNNAALLFSAMACGMLLLTLLMTHHRLSGIRVLSVHAFPAHEGDPVIVRLAMDHRSKRERLGINVALGLAHTAVNLPAGETVTVDLRIASLPRGAHPMGRLRVYTKRPLNIARAWSWLWPGQGFVVYPRLEANAPAPPGRGEEQSADRASRSGVDIHHLRDYRVGDALRDVAWKASAKSSKLMTREYETQGGGLRKLHWEDVASLPTEQALSRLASWVVLADQQGVATELRLPTGVIGPSQGALHRHACLSALAKVPAHGFA